MRNLVLLNTQVSGKDSPMYAVKASILIVIRTILMLHRVIVAIINRR